MNKYFPTSNVNLASWLMYKGFELKRMDQIDNTMLLKFENSENLLNAVREYNGNTELKAFITKFKQLREMMKTAKK